MNKHEIVSQSALSLLKDIDKSTFTLVAAGVVILIALVTIVFLIFKIKRDDKEARRQLMAALDSAKRAHSAKNLYTSRISHEIRTPLNSAIGYMTVARNSGENSEKMLDCIKKADLAAKHLLSILNDILDMSTIESGKFKIAHESFDLKELISSISAVYYAQASNRGIDFDIRVDNLTHEKLLGDYLRLNQIIMNLLSNAVKFTDFGGSVALGVKELAADDNHVKIRFTVTDTGIGMDNTFLNKLFKPYEQADISNNFAGTGLGLSISKGLISLMGGKISVQSEKGKGSVFTVEISFEIDKESSAAQAHNFNGIKAMLVIDDDAESEYISSVLNRFGVRCEALKTGKDAIQRFAEMPSGCYDMCVIDWPVCDMDGVELIDSLYDSGNGIKHVFVTAYDFSRYFDSDRKPGSASIVSKPVFQSSMFDLLVETFSKPRDEDKQSEASASSIAWDFSGRRILLAEDNDMNLDIEKEILNQVGFEVDCARNGREAAKMFIESDVDTYDAILMDIEMPVMNGYEAAKVIRISQHSRGSIIPIIAMTADAFKEDIDKARAAGMNDHIAKPIEIKNMFETLEKYIIY